MFYSVCHTRHAVLVAKISDIDVEGGTGLVRLWIMNE